MPHARVADVSIEHRAAYSLSEVAGLTGLSISGLYVLIGRGQLRSIRVGGRRLVPREALEELLTNRKPPVSAAATLLTKRKQEGAP
jgi:excisionase family DNA binding protein